jgi:hypothetical protein
MVFPSRKLALSGATISLSVANILFQGPKLAHGAHA